MIHVVAARNVWGYLVVMINDLCSFEALSWKSLWIKVSAKCINVNVTYKYKYQIIIMEQSITKCALRRPVCWLTIVCGRGTPSLWNGGPHCKTPLLYYITEFICLVDAFDHSDPPGCDCADR